jgi:hypothetical protein
MKLTYIITVASLAVTALAAPLPQGGSNNTGGCGKRDKICSAGKREEDTHVGVGWWKREEDTNVGVGWWKKLFKKEEDTHVGVGWWKREEDSHGVGWWKK